MLSQYVSSRVRAFFLILFAFVCLLPAAAGAESALVTTPKGDLNARKSPKSSAPIVFSVGRGSRAEVLEEQGDWCRVEYNGKKGWVKTEFLLIPSHTTGGVYYPEGGKVYRHREKDLQSPLCGVSFPDEPLFVLMVEDGLALVRPAQDPNAQPGWADAEIFLHQYKEAQGQRDWRKEQALATADCALTAQPGGQGDPVLTLSAGDEVTVLALEKNEALAEKDGILGFVPCESLWLKGLTDESHDLTGFAFTREEARGRCIEALEPLPEAAVEPEEKTRQSRQKEDEAKKETERLLKERKERLKALSESTLFDYTPREENGAPCLYCTLAAYEGRVLHTFLLSKDGTVIETRDMSAFSAFPPPEELPPEGAVLLRAENLSLKKGEPLLVSASARDAVSWECNVLLNGEELVSSGPDGHSRLYYMPRQAGRYRLEVTARSGAGASFTGSLDFTVSDEPYTGFHYYSQKDGSWADVPYRDSNLERSGCAVFALSHALQLLGFEGEEILPSVLAAGHPKCLTPEGTNNERLLRECGQELGFSTRGELLTAEKSILSWFDRGALFSFSVARGHIAMISGLSEDRKRVTVIDSAPSATFERFGDTVLYLPHRGGDFIPISDPDTLPQLYWCFETGNYAAAEYWTNLSYAAERGVRPILPDGK